VNHNGIEEEGTRTFFWSCFEARKSKRLQEKAKAVTIEGGNAVYLHDEELLKKLKEAVAIRRGLVS
jgi:hypothetical protein